jgi:hypothetical protein
LEFGLSIILLTQAPCPIPPKKSASSWFDLTHLGSVVAGEKQDHSDRDALFAVHMRRPLS